MCEKMIKMADDMLDKMTCPKCGGEVAIHTWGDAKLAAATWNCKPCSEKSGVGDRKKKAKRV